MAQEIENCLFLLPASVREKDVLPNLEVFGEKEKSLVQFIINTNYHPQIWPRRRSLVSLAVGEMYI
jgi:hypothetical protein